MKKILSLFVLAGFLAMGCGGEEKKKTEVKTETKKADGKTETKTETKIETKTK